MLRRYLLVLGLIGFLLSLASSSALAQTYKDLYDFNCATEGCNPNGLLAQGRDGNLYGTTPTGWAGFETNCGYYGCASVFRVTPSGAPTTLHKFDPNADSSGHWEAGGLASDGNFYGTTSGGGLYGWGTIFRITPSKTFTVLHNFDLYDDGGCCPSTSPIQASNGSLYGGASGDKPYRMTLAGKFTVLPNPVPDAGFSSLIQAADGYLYGTTQHGGAFLYYGSVFRLSLAGAVKTIYSFDLFGRDPAACDCYIPSGPLTQASDGNFYGTTANDVAFKLTPSGVLTVLHRFDRFNDGNGLHGLVAASDGNLYGVASYGGSIDGLIIDAGTVFRLTKSGAFSLLYTFDNTHGRTPVAMVQHTNGTLYGLTNSGGPGGEYGGGIFYSLDAGLPPFVALLNTGTSGTPGKTIPILGQGFKTATSVLFGSGSAKFTAVSDTYMTAVVPAEGTTGYVTVTTGSGALTSNRKFAVKPLITSFNPISGPPGTQVTITGGGFRGTTKVTFGGVKASFTVNSGSQITAVVPVGAVNGKIAVTTAGGTASKGTFTVN